MESRFDDDLLVDKALHALIQFVQRHGAGTVTERERPMLRFVLAYLYRGRDRHSYDGLWREANAPKGDEGAGEFGQFQSLRSHLAGILKDHGREYW